MVCQFGMTLGNLYMPASKTQYLFKQPKSNNWYVRLTPPKALKKLCPDVAPLRRSLQTSCLTAAGKLALQIRAETTQQWELLLAQHKASQSISLPDISIATKLKVLDDVTIKELVTSRLYSWAYSDAEERSNGLDSEDINQQQEFAYQTIEAMSEVCRSGPKASTWTSCAEDALAWAEETGVRILPSDSRLNDYIRQFASTEIAIQKRLLGVNKSEFSELIDGYLQPKIEEIYSSNNNQTPLWDLAIQKYEKHQKELISAKTLSTEINTLISLRKFCKEKLLESISQKDIYDFFNHQLLSKTWSSNRVKSHGRNTLNKFFNLCITNEFVNSNPLDKLKLLPQNNKKQDEERKRPNLPFSSEQMNSIFESQWYKEKNLFKGKLRKDTGARYWIPLIMMTHGLRVSEACQLTISDITLDDFVPTIRISAVEESDTTANSLKSIKCSSTNRVVPIHPILLELGFRDFIHKIKLSNQTFLFPSSIPDEDATLKKLGRSFEQAFLRYVRDKLGFGHGYGNHSFRHQLEDRIRDAKCYTPWPTGISQEYMGRSKQSQDANFNTEKEGSAALYGKGHKASNILKFIKTIDFSDIKLPPSFNEWESCIR